MNTAETIKNELRQFINPEKAAFLPGFFKAYPGGYGEGDLFIGVTVPHLRTVAKKYYKTISLEETENLLRDAVHEYRLTSLCILMYKFGKLKREEEKKQIVDLYLKNLDCVNNWDLVDLSADKILGAYLEDKERDLLFELAVSGNLWKQRIAIISTFHYIRKGCFADTLALVKMLLNHRHDLIHKAAGWMLREIGKRDFEAEYTFLQEHYRVMPRVMLRYAIEKFDPELRADFLQGKI